jgi:hypothetical protein
LIKALLDAGDRELFKQLSGRRLQYDSKARIQLGSRIQCGLTFARWLG